ncbi:MAG: MFS transporter [Gammaproteobacteria bacterium]
MSKITKFKGWQMVYTAMMMEFSVVGFVFYCFPLMFSHLERDLGATQSQLSGALSLFFIFSVVASIFLGRILDKYSVKKIMTIGGLIFGFGLLSVSFIENSLSLLLIYATFFAIGGPALGNLSVTKLVANWFETNAGMALGIAAIGISFSGVVLPILVDPLIDLIGWRNVYLVFGFIVFLVLLPVVRFFVIDTPEEIGQQKDDLEIQPEASKNTDLMEIADFFKSKIFWIISLTFAFQFFAMGGVLLHLPLHSEKVGFIETFSFVGFPVKQYVFAYSLAAFGGVLGKVLFGYLIDKLTANKPVMLMMLMQSIGIFGLTISNSYGLFTIFCFIFGMGFGGAMVLMSACFLKAFGSVNLGSVRGFSGLIVVPLQPVGIFIVGRAFDMNIYIEAFLMMGIVSLIAFAIGSRIVIR